MQVVSQTWVRLRTPTASSDDSTEFVRCFVVQEFAKIQHEIGDTATAPVSMHSEGPVDAAWTQSNEER